MPAVAVGERAVHGWNPAGYAELLGVDYRPVERLTPRELAARLDRVLDIAQALVQGLGREQMEWTPPERNRTVRDLGYHVFRLSLAFVDGMDRGEFPETWLQEPTPADLRDGPEVARYGALVRARLAGWFEGAGSDEYARVIKVYYGPQTGHDMLERTAWHAAQHLRQLYVLAERLGVTPPEPLPTETFRGLPLPASIW